MRDGNDKPVAGEAAVGRATDAYLGPFERYLSVWVGVCIVAGIVLGHWLPGIARDVGRLEVAHVNLVVGVLIWAMIIPMLVKIDFGRLHEVRQHLRGVGITLFVNWAIKPFSMALLAAIFIRGVFRPWLPPGEIDSYVAGLILLAAAPCTAMVFVWSNLTRGEPNFTLTQVALNDLIMVVAFGPIVALLLGVASISVPWATLAISVAMYIVVPLVLAQLLRRHLLGRGTAAFAAGVAMMAPWSMAALLATLILLFAFQGEAILARPLVITMLAVPILIQVFLNAGLAYGLNRRFGVAHCVAGPSALIGASNFFELAVAVAISLFGFESGAALATVVGVLIEVPVMLVIVRLVNRSRVWYERGIPRAA
jgi:arsenite transporter